MNEQDVAVGAMSVGQTTTVTVGVDAEMVAMSWDGKDAASFSVRGLDKGTWTDWVQLDASLGDQPDENTGRTRTTAGPAWIALDLRVFQVRLDSGAPTGLRLHALDVESAADSATAASGGFALGPSVASAETPAPFIASRAMWGADESFRNMYPNCTTPDYADSVDFAVIHHTDNSNNYGPGDSPALIRGIYYFHTHDNGWCDIGYNFLIDRFGQIWEGRYGGGHMPVIASHAGGFNYGSTGISMLGDYDVAPVPQAAYLALVDLLAWKFKYHGIDPNGTVTHTVAIERLQLPAVASRHSRHAPDDRRAHRRRQHELSRSLSLRAPTADTKRRRRHRQRSGERRSAGHVRLEWRRPRHDRAVPERFLPHPPDQRAGRSRPRDQLRRGRLHPRVW